MHVPPETAWIIHDGAAGNRRQAHALAAAMALDASEWSLQARGPARWFAPRRLPGSHRASGPRLPPRSRARCPTGSSAAAGRRPWRPGWRGNAARARSRSSIPRIDPRHWDLVIAPRTRRPARRQRHHPDRQPEPGGCDVAGGGARAIPRPRRPARPAHGRVAGRSDDSDPLRPQCVRSNAGHARRDAGRRKAAACCSAARGARRRNSPRACANAAATGADLAWFDDSDGVNPYPGALAWADRIVVSPDSVNMVSEACATEVPVFVAEPGSRHRARAAFPRRTAKRPGGSGRRIATLAALRRRAAARNRAHRRLVRARLQSALKRQAMRERRPRRCSARAASSSVVGRAKPRSQVERAIESTRSEQALHARHAARAASSAGEIAGRRQRADQRRRVARRQQRRLRSPPGPAPVPAAGIPGRPGRPRPA